MGTKRTASGPCGKGSDRMLRIDAMKILEALAGLLQRAAGWLMATEFWESWVAPYPVQASLAGTAILVLALMAQSARTKAVARYLAADRHAQAARRASDYYRNKLRDPDASLEIHDKKLFRRCDPLRDGMVPAESLEKMAWDWSWCRYVAGLIASDAEESKASCASTRRCVRRDVKKSFRDAARDIPDKCRVWLAYIDKKGRRRDTYRFTYEPDEVLARVPADTREAVRLLEAQGFRCAKCGRDPDDGTGWQLSPDGSAAWCDECGVQALAADAIQKVRAEKLP